MPLYRYILKIGVIDNDEPLIGTYYANGTMSGSDDEARGIMAGYRCGVALLKKAAQQLSGDIVCAEVYIQDCSEPDKESKKIDLLEGGITK